ncbi:MAG: hypothetical protein K8Q91_00010 [Candidatus Vogelbacteria bacterium]|nr:hypothetical protein [Candidatus Vogelbacteria bacterium]
MLPGEFLHPGRVPNNVVLAHRLKPETLDTNCPTSNFRIPDKEAGGIRLVADLHPTSRVNEETEHVLLPAIQPGSPASGHLRWHEAFGPFRDCIQHVGIEEPGAARLDRLTDAYLDQAIEKEAYQSRQASHLEDQQRLKEKLRDAEAVLEANRNQLQDFLELVKSLTLLYELGTDDEKRNVVQSVFSNQTAFGKDVVVTLYFPFQAMANRPPVLDCAHARTRTWDLVIIDGRVREKLKH